MSELNLHQKLVEIRKEVDYLKKDTEGYHYDYTSGTTILEKIRGKMDELGVLIYPRIGDTETVQQAKNWVVRGDMTFILQNAKDPEDKIEIAFKLNGMQDSPAKALGTALTYSERYFLLKFFNIPTDADDPDARQRKNKQKMIQEYQRKIKNQLKYLKNNAIDNFDVPKRLQNSVQSNLNANKISECNNLKKLKEYNNKLTQEDG